MTDPSPDDVRAVVEALALPDETGELLDDEADVPVIARLRGWL
jgi:hypothetical protein